MKTCIYIDAANIILSARDSGLDFEMIKLIIYLKNKYKTINVIYFSAKFKLHENLYNDLCKINVELVFKQYYREHNKIKANCDVEIAHRITYDIENKVVESIILASGDGDFVSLLDYAQSKLKGVRCFGVHPNNTSKMLKSRKYLRIIHMNQVIDNIQKREDLDTDFPV